MGWAAGIGAAAAVIGAGVSVYAASQKPNAPKAPPPIAAPKLPVKPAQAPNYGAGDLAARSAGGTLLAKQSQQQVTDSGGGVRKTLLGTALLIGFSPLWMFLL